MLTIENTYKILDVPIFKNRVVEYYIRNTTEYAGAYQIHLRCPRKSKSDELIMLYRTPEVVGPNGEMTYTMYDNSNPMNKIYLPTKDIKEMKRFVSSIDFFVNKYILC
jgi:hypothetical protein